MNSTRTGKIARLPKDTREQLNLRLENGQSGPEILAWLNNDRIAQYILEEHFENPTVSEQNLSEWRHGGYQDWLRQQQTLALASRLVEDSHELADKLGDERLPDRFANLLATEFIDLARTILDDQKKPKKRWAALCKINEQLSRLRRDDHRAIHTLIRKEQFSRKIDAQETAEADAADKEDRRQNILRYQYLRTGMVQDYAKLYGTDDIAHDIAAMALEQQNNLEFGMLGRESDYFALRKDIDEPTYPWNRRRKKHARKTTETANTEMVGRASSRAANVDQQETSASPLQSEDVKPSEPSPRGSGQGEGEFPSREAANISAAPGTAPTNPPIQESINPVPVASPAAPCPSNRPSHTPSALHTSRPSSTSSPTPPTSPHLRPNQTFEPTAPLKPTRA